MFKYYFNVVKTICLLDDLFMLLKKNLKFREPRLKTFLKLKNLKMHCTLQK